MIRNAKEKLEAIRNLIFKEQPAATVGTEEKPAEDILREKEGAPMPEHLSTPAMEQEMGALEDRLQVLQQQYEALEKQLSEVRSAVALEEKRSEQQKEAFHKALELMEELAAAPVVPPVEKRKNPFSARKIEPADKIKELAEAMGRMRK